MPPSPDTRAQELLEQGASLYEAGKLYEALSCWKQVLEIDPGNEIAAEYLRFIEDNFQIGVDEFIEHHSGQISRPPEEEQPPSHPPPQVVQPPRVYTPPPVGHSAPPPPPEEMGVGDGLSLDESIEELDWSEILDEEAPDAPGVAPTTPPPVPGALPVDGDEDFFAELEPGSIDPQPGEEAAAWGAASVVEELPPVRPREDPAPMADPLALPTDRFAAPYRPPVSGDHGSVSQEILPGDPNSRRRTSSEHQLEPRRDISAMSEDSIEMMLDDDFKAWEESSAPQVGEDSTDLEDLLAGGLGAEVGSAPKAVDPGALPATVPMPAVDLSKNTGELEALLRSGLDEINAIESGDGPPPRQLIKAPSPGADLDGMMARARKKQQAGDFSGSLALVEDVLAGDPTHAEARRYLAENTNRLLSMYRSKLGNMRRAPKVKLRPQEIIWQSLDHRAGFVLSQVDGMTSYEDIVEISGMEELEATRILARLVEHGVIG